MLKVKVPCCDETHTITITDSGKFKFDNHTIQEYRAEKLITALADREDCSCFRSLSRFLVMAGVRELESEYEDETSTIIRARYKRYVGESADGDHSAENEGFILYELAQRLRSYKEGWKLYQLMRTRRKYQPLILPKSVINYLNPTHKGRVNFVGMGNDLLAAELSRREIHLGTANSSYKSHAYRYLQFESDKLKTFRSQLLNQYKTTYNRQPRSNNPALNPNCTVATQTVKGKADRLVIHTPIRAFTVSIKKIQTKLESEEEERKLRNAIWLIGMSIELYLISDCCNYQGSLAYERDIEEGERLVKECYDTNWLDEEFINLQYDESSLNPLTNKLGLLMEIKNLSKFELQTIAKKLEPAIKYIKTLQTRNPTIKLL